MTNETPPPPRGVRPDPAELAWSYARTQKDPAVDELIDIYFHRPIAYALLRQWEHRAWRPTPNQFTLTGGAFGLLAAAVALVAAPGSLLWPLAALLMFVANILDCCDGMMARLTGQASNRGMLLDGMIDFIVGVSFWLAMSIRTAPDWGIWTIPAALSIVLSILVHCGLYDHMRIRFGVLVNPPAPTQPKATAPTTDKPNPSSASERFLDGFYAFAQAFYEVTYTNISRICVGVEPSSPRPAVHPDFARQLFSGPMRMASYLGLSTQLFLMYTATALALWDLNLPFQIALWSMVVALNIWAALVVSAWRRAESLIAGIADLGEANEAAESGERD